MENINTIEFYSKYSAQFDQKIASLENYNQSYIDFAERAKSKSNLLDLACGPGNVSKFIQHLIPEIQITCVDLSPAMIETAKTKITNAQFYVADLLNINIPLQKYDLITCAFGLPYIEKDRVMDVVSQIDLFCHPDTLVYISCMKGTQSQRETMSFGGDERVLVHYHEKETITEKFEDCNFELVDYREQNYYEPNGNISIDMIFNFRKG